MRPAVAAVAVAAALLALAAGRPSGAAPAAPPPDVSPFLSELGAALRSGDVAAALPFFDPENLAAQRKLGVSDAQYVAEAIGLHREARLAGKDVPEPDPWDAAAELAAVTRIVIEKVARDEAQPAAVHATGRVELRDGRAYALDLLLLPGGSRGWRIAPPVG